MLVLCCSCAGVRPHIPKCVSLRPVTNPVSKRTPHTQQAHVARAIHGAAPANDEMATAPGVAHLAISTPRACLAPSTLPGASIPADNKPRRRALSAAFIGPCYVACVTCLTNHGGHLRLLAHNEILDSIETRFALCNIVMINVNSPIRYGLCGNLLRACSLATVRSTAGAGFAGSLASPA